MSVRAEYIPATSPVHYVNENDLAEDVWIDDPKDRMVLTLSYDELIVIVGTPQQIDRLGQRIRNAVAGALAAQYAEGATK